MDWYPLWNSLRIAAISTVIIFFLGILAAYYVAKLPRLVKGVLDVVLTLPLVLPPTVVGYFLLRLLGPKRTIGLWFLENVRPAAHHGVVFRCFRLRRRGIPAHVPHGARGLRVL